MAYVSKELKAQLVAEIKKVMPKSWKASYAIRNYSTLIVTISKAPLDLHETFSDMREEKNEYRVSEYHFKDKCLNEEVKNTLEKIVNAMNGQNYNNSDVMTDYFDVGYYTELRFGKWDKEFVNTNEK